PAARNACTPIQIRYRAPISFKAVNATSDARTTDARPMAAASVHTESPALTPSDVPRAVRRPWRRTFFVTTAVSGPGMTITIAATPTNTSTWTPTPPVCHRPLRPGAQDGVRTCSELARVQQEMSTLLHRVRFRLDHRWAPNHMSDYLDG